MGVRHGAQRIMARRCALQSVAGLFCAAVAGLMLCVLAPASAAQAATINVTTTNDTIAGADGCSLREAILNANNNQVASTECAAGDPAPTIDVITFTISTGLQTIAVAASGLPSITAAVSIDGTLQPGFSSMTGIPVIELDGTLATASDGLSLGADGITVKGLTINRFGVSGINISGPNGKVYGSYIGVNAAGMAAAPNASDGITVDGMNATIGGIGTNERNVISGNSDNGVFICVCANATIVGNYIGTDKNGTLPVGNDTWGVQILNAQNVTVSTTPR